MNANVDSSMSNGSSSSSGSSDNNNNNFFVQLWNMDGDPLTSLQVKCSGDEDEEEIAFEAEHMSDSGGGISSGLDSWHYSNNSTHDGSNATTTNGNRRVKIKSTRNNGLNCDDGHDEDNSTWEDNYVIEQFVNGRYRNKTVNIREEESGFEYEVHQYEKDMSESSGYYSATYPSYRRDKRRFMTMIASAMCMVFITIFASFMIRNKKQVGDIRGVGNSNNKIVNFFSSNKHHACRPTHVEGDTLNYVELELALRHNNIINSNNRTGGSLHGTSILADNQDELESNLMLSLEDTENQRQLNQLIVSAYNDVTDGGCNDKLYNRYMKSVQVQSVDISSTTLSTSHIAYVITWMTTISCNGCTSLQSFADNYTTQYHDDHHVGRRYRNLASTNHGIDNEFYAYEVIDKIESKVMNTIPGDVQITDALIKIMGSDSLHGSGGIGDDGITTTSAADGSSNAVIPQATFLGTFKT